MFQGLVSFWHSLASFLTFESIFLVLASSLVGVVIGALPGLTATIGIAPNRLLAKLASDFQKPDGLTLMRADEIAARFDQRLIPPQRVILDPASAKPSGLLRENEADARERELPDPGDGDDGPGDHRDLQHQGEAGPVLGEGLNLVGAHRPLLGDAIGRRNRLLGKLGNRLAQGLVDFRRTPSPGFAPRFLDQLMDGADGD